MGTGTKTKMSKKTKKAIRRSIAGVCLVSSIIVAAVPATNTSAYIAPGSDSNGTSYVYGVEATDETPDTILSTDGVNLGLYDKESGTCSDGSTVHKILNVKQLTDGTYNVNWMFKGYLQNVQGSNMLVLCEYNSTYQTNEVVINPSMPYQYCTIETTSFDNFFSVYANAETSASETASVPCAGGNKTLPARYTMSQPAETLDQSYDEYWLKNYFPDEYNSFITNKYNPWKEKDNVYQQYLLDYAVYESELAAWNELTPEQQAGKTKPTPPTVVANPGPCPTLTCYVNEMNINYKYKYFCKIYPKGDATMENLFGSDDYTLTKVADSRTPNTGAEAKYVYMPKGTPNSVTGDMNNNDEFGFLVLSKAFVIAIGENAFKGTTNVHTLDLCKEIKYIGDEAFMDSFVTKVTFSNVEKIGNRAFKNCTQLTDLDFKSGTTHIGTEAFYGCGFKNITFPWSVKYIGPGAFAACTKLSQLHFENITAACEIDDFAFFNDVALADVDFYDESTGTNGIFRIGEAAFACTMGVSGALNTFEFPDNIIGMVTRTTGGQTNGIGNFVLAGRTNLKNVVMPADYGKANEVELPYGVFFNCTNLECVKFPDEGGACGFVTFGTYNDGTRTIFDTIMNEDFYVYGPEKNIQGGIAYPRKSTWGQKSGLNKSVPYVYKDSQGYEKFEVSDGFYILIIDDDGILTSCKLIDDDDIIKDVKDNGLDLVIPEMVGDTKVTGIASDCFEDEIIHDNIRTLTIEDNSISEIRENAFAGCTRLVAVAIGDSVTKIGEGAFKGCDKLTQVSFATPANGYAAFPLENIGAEAFATGAGELTFVGDIDEAYGPFEWAMQLDNYVKKSDGTRVCYKTAIQPDEYIKSLDGKRVITCKSENPSYLTVIVDNVNGLPTLVDYPHYEQLNEISGTTGAVYTTPSGKVLSVSLTDRFENLGQEEYAADGSLEYTYTLSLDEEKLINAVINVNVPKGVKSIDANGFINNTSKKTSDSPTSTGFTSNSSSVSKYVLQEDNYATYKKQGLFNGYYGDYNGNEGAREYESGSGFELEDIGNDRIQSITLNSVKYLPDHAFESCERLIAVNLGNDLEDMGEAPFKGCTNLTSIASNSDAYATNNGIIYKKLPDGSYRILEVLSTRGSLVGSQKVKVSDEDPLLSKVSEIADGAFEGCEAITGVDFRNMGLLSEIPKNCFKDCEKLNQIILPENVTAIRENAFEGTPNGVEVVVYGREVYLAPSSFGGASEDPTAFRVISYSDSAVRKAAAAIGADVTEVLDDTVKVQFLDYDGRALSNIIYVVVGGSLQLTDIPDDPVRPGYTFTGWSKKLTNITQDTIIVATYKQNQGSSDVSGNTSDTTTTPTTTPTTTSTSTTTPTTTPTTTSTSTSGPGGGTTGGNNGGSTQFFTLTVTDGNGSGSYAAGATVIISAANPPSGKTFDKWVAETDDLGIASVSVAATTMTMPAHNASVTATFKTASSNSNSSNNGNNTGSNNTNNGGTTSTNNGNTVLVSKPGISNTGLASVTVSGSTDNYVVRISETAAATSAVETALKNEYGNLDSVRYSAMDISLYDSTGSTKITDTTGLSITITMPIPDALTQYAGNNKVAGVVNEKLDKLNPKFTTIDGVPCVTFTATHFSPYTVYVDTGNLTSGTTLDETPKTGDFHPKWLLSIGLFAMSIALFFMRDKAPSKKKRVTA